MKASPKEQQQLLELQQADLKLGRLSHAMKTHPLRAKLAELEGRAADLERFVVGQTTVLQDAGAKASALEEQIGRVRARKDLQQDRLESGKVGVRDMSAVEHEILQIGARQDQLEGELLGLMEAIEAAEQRVADAKAQVEALRQDESQTLAQLESELQEPIAEREATAARIAELRDALPDEVTREYDRLRERQGPVAVLQLREGSLVNSPVSLAREELDQAAVAPEDELWISEETGFLVVRVPK